jgi:DNA-binding transcriptional regulator/RsmH inhibitor MraZ
MITTQGQIWIYISNLVIQISIKKSVINVGIRLYNKVAMHIKKLEEYKPYKRELKSFLIDHAFYSVKEFLCC